MPKRIDPSDAGTLDGLSDMYFRWWRKEILRSLRLNTRPRFLKSMALSPTFHRHSLVRAWQTFALELQTVLAKHLRIPLIEYAAEIGSSRPLSWQQFATDSARPARRSTCSAFTTRTTHM